MQDKIAILSPCANSVEPRAYQSAMLLAANASENNKIEFIGVTERMLIHTARNVLSEGFLKTGCEWAFWLDSDMMLPPKTISIMIKWAKELNAKFLTGVYYQRVGEHRPVIGIRDDKLMNIEDDFSTTTVSPTADCSLPFKIDACGFGCVLIHRDVYKDMAQPYFMHGLTEKGKEYSEDYYFCSNARKNNIDIWAIPELNCGHIGEAPIIFRKDYIPKEKKYVDVKFYEKK